MASTVIRGSERKVRLVHVSSGRNRGRTCVIGERKPDEMPKKAFKKARPTMVAAGCFSSAADARARAVELAERAHVGRKGKLRLSHRGKTARSKTRSRGRER